MALFGGGSSHQLNAFLGNGVEYTGRLEFTGTVRVDGRFQGEIVSDGTLVLGRDAVVEGDIRVARLSSNGVIRGQVTATKMAVLMKSSTLEGRLRAPSLVVEEGAVIEGGVEMAREPSEPDQDLSGPARTTAEAEAAVQDADAETGTDGASNLETDADADGEDEAGERTVA